MEMSLSGNNLKTLTQSITCLARIGNELAVQASPAQLAFHTLNSSRSAYQSVTFKREFFDVYTVSAPQVQYSVLLKAVCSVLRTPVASVDRLSVVLPNSDASKVQWTLECHYGMKKSYWITCNIEPDIQHLSLDRTKFPSRFVVKPRVFNRLLANFQSSLQEITVIATEPTSLPSDVASEIGGKAVELRSYIDPSKDDSDTALHTQLWIDPIEEFLQYVHTGDPVDVTFGVKELKAFLSFCEGSEVDIHLFFEKAGEPILMAPRFGLDDGLISDFDVTLVLATMLISQLHERNPFEQPVSRAARTCGQTDQGTGSTANQDGSRAATSDLASDHTRIWSELSGSAARSGSGAETRQAEVQVSPPPSSGQNGAERTNPMGVPRENMPDDPNLHQPMETQTEEEPQGRDEMEGRGWSQHHPSNWVGADEDDDEDDDEDENELCVQSTPPY